MPGGQQQPAFDPFLGTAPEIAVMVSFLTIFNHPTTL